MWGFFYPFFGGGLGGRTDNEKSKIWLLSSGEKWVER